MGGNWGVLTQPRTAPLMDAATLLTTVLEFLPGSNILEHSSNIGLVQRARELDIVALVISLVLTAGSDDSGRQTDAYSKYLEESDKHVVRGAFYAWFTDKLALLLTALCEEAMEGMAAVLTGDLRV